MYSYTVDPLRLFVSCEGELCIIVQHFTLHKCIDEIRRVCRYLLALDTSLSVCQPHILDESLLTLVQIPGLGHMNLFILLLLKDGICGLAHSLSSSLTRNNYAELHAISL